MLSVLVLMLLTVSPVHSQTPGFHRYGLIQACNETKSDFSLMFDGEQVLYFDYEHNLTVLELPDFADPVESPDVSGDALRGARFCKDALEALTTAYTNPPVELESPWSSIYPKNEVKLKTENTLICHVFNFFPPPVRVSWTKNDLNVIEGVTLSQYYQNSDGTLSVFSTLSFTPEEGDIYTCTVDHRALENPQTRIWDVQVDQSSVFPTVVCVAGVILGFLGAVAGIFLIIRANNPCS